MLCASPCLTLYPCRAQLQLIFKEFMGTHYDVEELLDPADFSGSGDVKYHLGTSHNRECVSGSGRAGRFMGHVVVVTSVLY
jgi:hypothetical protein